MSNKLFDKMLAVDSNYGHEKHQRGYMAWVDRCQQLEPCSIDHTHGLGCYLEHDHSEADSEGAKGRNCTFCYSSKIIEQAREKS